MPRKTILIICNNWWNCFDISVNIGIEIIWWLCIVNTTNNTEWKSIFDLIYKYLYIKTSIRNKKLTLNLTCNLKYVVNKSKLRTKIIIQKSHWRKTPTIQCRGNALHLPFNELRHCLKLGSEASNHWRQMLTTANHHVQGDPNYLPPELLNDSELFSNAIGRMLI